MLPKIFAVYHPSTETFQILQTEILEDGTVSRLKCWARPSLRDWSTTSDEEKIDLLKWGNGQEWYVCKTNRALSDTHPTIYQTQIHGKSYSFWFLNHMLIWSNYAVYRERHGAGRESWMNSPMIPVVEFQTKQLYPRTQTGMYTYWSETSKEDLEVVSVAARAQIRDSGQMEESIHEHVDPRYLRIRTPSPREEDWQTPSECCKSNSKHRGRGFSDTTEQVYENLGSSHRGASCTETASLVLLLGLVCMWGTTLVLLSV